MKTYYKFYPLTSKSYIKDVMKHKRLYMPTYRQLWTRNDQNEGKYLLSADIKQQLKKHIKAEKLKFRICCLTNKVLNAEMWRTFADNGRGICFAVQPLERKVERYNVVYENGLPKIRRRHFKLLSSEQIATTILTHKVSSFSDENETRFLKKVTAVEKKVFLSVHIIKLYLGWNISADEEKEWRALAAKYAIHDIIKLQKPIL